MILFCFVATLGFSQTIQGTNTLAGGIDYLKLENSSSTSFNVNYGSFAADDLLWMLNFGFSNSKSPSGSPGLSDQVNTDIEIGPALRKYVHTSSEEFAFFVEGGFNVGFGTDEFETGAGTTKVKSGSLNVYAAPGFSYFFSQNWAVDISFAGFQYIRSNPDKDVDGNESSVFFVGLNSLAPSGFSIRYFFNGN